LKEYLEKQALLDEIRQYVKPLSAGMTADEAGLYAELYELIRKMPAEEICCGKCGEWYNITEKKPKDGQKVIVYTHDGDFEMVGYNAEYGYTYPYYGGKHFYWMPLPEKPKG